MKNIAIKHFVLVCSNYTICEFVFFLFKKKRKEEGCLFLAMHNVVSSARFKIVMVHREPVLISLLSKTTPNTSFCTLAGL